MDDKNSIAELHIIDVGNPELPVLRGIYRTRPTRANRTWPGNRFSLKDHTVFWSEGGTGLDMIDVSDPSRPLRIGQWATDGGEAMAAILPNKHLLVVVGDVIE